MDIFGRKKRLEAKVGKMSDEEFEQFMQEDYAKKERRAKWTAIIAGAVTVAAVLALGVTGASVGLAVYKIAFGAVATLALGGAAVGTSSFLRRKFKVLKEIKESLNAEIEKGKSRKGRTLTLGKQVNKEHKRAKALDRMVKRGQLSARQAEAYQNASLGVASAAKSGRVNTAATREAVMAALKGNREQLKFRIDGGRDDFFNKEAGNFEANNSKKGRIFVLMRDYNADGTVKLNADGSEMFTPVVSLNCNSDIDIIKSQAIVYDALANGDVEGTVKVVNQFKGKETVVEFNTKEELIEYNNEFKTKSDEFLDSRRKAPEAKAEKEETHESTEKESTKTETHEDASAAPKMETGASVSDKKEEVASFEGYVIEGDKIK